MRKMIWVAAGLVLSLALHLVAAWLWLAEDTPIGAPELGDGGITITLAEPGALAGDDAAPGQNDEGSPQQEPVPEPVSEIEPAPDTESEPEQVTQAENSPEPAHAPTEAAAIAPVRDVPDQTALPTLTMLQPLDLPNFMAADGIVTTRQKRQKPLMRPAPDALQLLDQANRVKARRPAIASKPPALPQPIAAVVVAKKMASRQTMKRSALTRPPQQVQPVEFTRPAPPPPPARPREIVSVKKPNQVEPVQPHRVASVQANQPPSAATTEKAALVQPARSIANGTSSEGAAGATDAVGKTATTGEGGQAKASQGGTGAGQARRRGGSQVGLKNDYLHMIRAWLEKHKRYPRRAKRRQKQGVAKLRFVVDRAGRVVSYKILAGTGHAMLDDAVHDMIRRARPLPAMPATMTAGTLALTVPVSFTLR